VLASGVVTVTVRVPVPASALFADRSIVPVPDVAPVVPDAATTPLTAETRPAAPIYETVNAAPPTRLP